MYHITANGSTLYHPLDESLAIVSARLRQNANLAASFVFSLFPNHPFYNSFDKLSTIVQVFDEGVLLFTGRVLNDSVDIQNMKTVVCESELAYFSDTVVRPYQWTDGGPAAYLSWLLQQHNQQVGPDKHFSLGTVTVTDPNDRIYRASGVYPTTWTEIESKLVRLLGGFLTVTYDGDGTRRLNYLADINVKSGQVVELGVNILDLYLERSGQEIATAIIPLGATIEPPEDNLDPPEALDEPSFIQDEEGGPLPADAIEPQPFAESQVSSPRVTIASENGGSDFIYDQNAVNRFGWIFKTVVYDDVTLPSNLLTRGRAELARNLEPRSALTIRAVDLAKTGQNIDDFRFLEYVDISSPGNGITGQLLVTEMDIDLLDASNCTLTVGSDFGWFTFHSIDIGDRVENVLVDQVLNDTVIDVQNNIRILQTMINATAAGITTRVEEINRTVTAQGNTLGTLGTGLDQTSRDFLLFVQETFVNTIRDVQGDYRSYFNDIFRYMRFDVNGLWLGLRGNAFQLNITNNRISFLENGAEVAYISDDRLYVTNGQFNSTLRVGNFAFTPRSNGNLSFTHV